MITLQFVRGGDFSAKAIEWFSHGVQVSHVDTVMPDGRLFGARAQGGVALRPADYLGYAPVVFRVQLSVSAEQEAEYYKFLIAQEGKPYDEVGIAAFITGRDWREPGSWFCSELVSAGLEACGYFPHPLASPSNKITPADLVLLLSVQTPIVTLAM